ncbi:MAG: hypothetical protein E7194_07775 [Erysipelotrichaceae bacterium]|nr:hypothetical protein [Erysipelotrichaceae bacterium]
MHKTKWKPLRVNNDFIFSNTVHFTYEISPQYNAAMLMEDLKEAGIVIESISCEKETGTISYTPETFLKDYEQIRSDGTDYVISCVWNDIPFQACAADDLSGRSYNRVIISSQSLCFDVNHLVSLLGGNHESDQ